jgi:hypothetical protein
MRPSPTPVSRRHLPVLCQVSPSELPKVIGRCHANWFWTCGEVVVLGTAEAATVGIPYRLLVELQRLIRPGSNTANSVGTAVAASHSSHRFASEKQHECEHPTQPQLQRKLQPVSDAFAPLPAGKQIKRPRGRPPKGKVWDHAVGRYIPVELPGLLPPAAPASSVGEADATGGNLVEASKAEPPKVIRRTPESLEPYGLRPEEIPPELVRYALIA